MAKANGLNDGTTGYGYASMHTRMDAHVKREANRSEPRKTSNPRDRKGRYKKAHHIDSTKGRRVKRGEPYALPYGGKPNETIVRGMGDKKRWKQRIREQRDQIGNRVARESRDTKPGCVALTVDHTEARALAHKIRAAVKGGYLREKLSTQSGSKAYRTRIERVLTELTRSQTTGERLSLGVFTREELRIIASQRVPKRYDTSTTQRLNRKLREGNRARRTGR